MGIALRIEIVERVVDLVENVGVALVLGIEMLCSRKRCWQCCVYGLLWKIIFRSCCYSVLFNHQDSPIANMLRGKYLSVVHVHLVQYNNQQVTT
jgi:hypothetical protein